MLLKISPKNILALFFLLLAFNCGCKKAKSDPGAPPPEPVVSPPIVSKPPPSGLIEIGTGTGPLIIKDQSDQNFIIKAGTYSYVQIENLRNCTIAGYDAKVEGGNVSLSAVNNVTISGLSVVNSKYRAFNINKEANDLILKDLIISNIGDVCMVFNINKVYDGTPASYSNNIQLINIKADNISTFIGTNGSVTETGFTGLIKNFKMSDCTISNSPNLADGVYLGLAEDYEFSNNVINNVNSTQGNHNGIFHVVGNGKIFNNKCTNHQGNMVRAWMCSITKPGSVEIYNNVVWNSTRYGAFELQVPPYLKALGAFKPGTNAKVYNNTVGKLNTGLPKYFEGRLLDLYDTYSTVEVYNNLLFNNSDNIILNKMSTDGLTTLTRNTNNIYKNSATEAVLDFVSFKSLISGVGKQ